MRRYLWAFLGTRSIAIIEIKQMRMENPAKALIAYVATMQIDKEVYVAFLG